MSTWLQAPPRPAPWLAPQVDPQPAARLVLFGAGIVGRALLQRLATHARKASDDSPVLRLVGVADSRRRLQAVAGIEPSDAVVELRRSGFGNDVDALIEALGSRGVRIAVDATASQALAARHADWLARGIHVVTASKIGQGSTLERWQAIRAAAARSGARYGDAATVGAGLPLLHTVRALRAGGDRIHAIAGTLSGSLAWLFDHHDGSLPFSDLVRAARQRGYTEPDPRDDLSGEDVRRKLLILVRSAGIALEHDAVATGSVLTAPLRAAAPDEVDAALATLDAPLQQQLDAARAAGRCLRHVARFDADGARVGLEALHPSDPLAQGHGCNNRVAIWSDRYREHPLLIQGPGAGAEVTAAALLDDVLSLAQPG